MSEVASCLIGGFYRTHQSPDPAILHLTRIGCTYFGKISEDRADIVYDSDTNIPLDVFKR
ncbi:hypothetical protein DXD49_09375 [Collinsella sp. TM05-38]|nr:hypothetical protein DXD49_09375 [Collinsella sp. TM05-38]